MLFSLRARLTLFFALVFAGLGIALWLATTLLLRAQAEQDTQAILRTAAEQLMVEWQDPKTAQEELREDDRFSRVAVTVLDAQGHVVVASRREVAPWPRPSGQDDHWRVQQVQVGKLTLILGVNWQETERMLWRQARLLALLTLVLSALATILARLVIGRTLRPIGALVAQADALAEASGSTSDVVLLRVPSQDVELRQLVTTLNTFLARQRETLRLREEFASTASHELRTPLTVLQGTLEVALSRPREALEYHETLGHLQTEVQRMVRLTESLLLLSRLSDPDKKEAQETVDLSAICAEILSSLVPLQIERCLNLKLELEPHVLIESSPIALSVLVRNLLDNAHRYVVPGTTLQVTLAKSPTVLTIVNVAEPPGTARATQSRGAGLGLTLCQRIADAYGWSLDFQRPSDRFQVRVHW